MPTSGSRRSVNTGSMRWCPLWSYSWQHKIEHGYDLQAFIIHWSTQQAHCPQGHSSVKWTPGCDASGDPVIRIRSGRATCRTCPSRQVCTTAKGAPRQLTVRPQAHHEAILTARVRQEMPEFKAQYALRSGVESSLSQGIRRFDLRQSRYIGLARTHLQQLLTTAAMNIVRVRPGSGVNLWDNIGRRRATLPTWHLSPYHARWCSVKG
jgi:transposase